MYKRIAIPDTNPVAVCRDNIIPEYICLPDGRHFVVTDLINQVANRQSILRICQAKISTPGAKNTQTRPKKTKYSQQERIIIASSTVQEVSVKYKLTDLQSYNLINNSRMMIGWQRTSRKNMR